jgi:hypothetical protein
MKVWFSFSAGHRVRPPVSTSATRATFGRARPITSSSDRCSSAGPPLDRSRIATGPRA